MSEFGVLLALTYFKEKKQEYTVGELSTLLGYNTKQMTELLSYLIDKQYIEYDDSLLSITGKGLVHLISHNHAHMVFEADKIIPVHIRPESAIPIEQPYVPRGFSKKY